jgi:ElaB/YqjD/DUF883 family membrane-anchored ribosome-binding protein
MSSSARKPTDPAEIQRQAKQAGQQLGDTAASLADKASEAAETVRAKAEDGLAQAKAMTDQTMTMVPPPARRRIEDVMAMMRRKPAQTIAIALAACLVLRRLMRRDGDE